MESRSCVSSKLDPLLLAKILLRCVCSATISTLVKSGELLLGHMIGSIGPHAEVHFS